MEIKAIKKTVRNTPVVTRLIVGTITNQYYFVFGVPTVRLLLRHISEKRYLSEISLLRFCTVL